MARGERGRLWRACKQKNDPYLSLQVPLFHEKGEKPNDIHSTVETSRVGLSGFPHNKLFTSRYFGESSFYDKRMNTGHVHVCTSITCMHGCMHDGIVNN